MKVPNLCKFNQNVLCRLGDLGAKCLHSRVDVDLEDWPVINKWMESVLDKIKKLELKTNMDYLDLTNQTEDTGYSRTKPFTAAMTVSKFQLVLTYYYYPSCTFSKVKYSLTNMETLADKETIHAEFDLTGSDITYACGDALGIYPLNNPPEVKSMIDALHTSTDLLVPVPPFCYNPKPLGEKMPLQEALAKYYDLKLIKLDLVKLLIGSVTDASQKERGKALLKEGVKLVIYYCDNNIITACLFSIVI